MKTRGAQPPLLDALIIGAGFSGLYQLYCLREKLGLNVKVVEAGAAVGGTWYWNRYPGARCDSESHVYCYTFSKELSEEWSWSERYPGPAEIVRYLEYVSNKFALHRSIDFDTRVNSAQFDKQAKCWNVETDSGKSYRARFLVTAVGCLSSANIPSLEGLQEFTGEWYHTGQWPEQGVDFRGKRVGQIGTGSTGIQAAPVIASTAKHLTVFQRTANFSIPARNRVLSETEQKSHKLNAAATRNITRTNTSGHGWVINPQQALKTAARERNHIYEHAWKTGGLKFRSAFSDLLNDSEANATAAQFIRNKIKAVVNDPDTASVLSDIDHPYGAKRPPIDTQYFEMYNRDNVSLVDLRSTPITKIGTHGVQCCSKGENGETIQEQHDVDILVFATGYDAITGTLLKIDIRGRENEKLQSAWADGPRNHLGIQVAGFPNLFMITGPGSPCVLTNMPAAIEQHVEWITDCIAFMDEGQHSVIESPESSVEKWVNTVNEEAKKTLLPSVKHSWYLGANIPGKPQVFMPYAGGLDKYRDICHNIARQNYKGFIIS